MRPAYDSRRYRIYGREDLHRIPQLKHWTAADQLALQAVAAVLPFRVNSYVLEELIQWDRIPEDPIFQLTFPQPGMLSTAQFDQMFDLVADDAGQETIQQAARRIQTTLNPHPSGQQDLNAPSLDDAVLPGVQHKYPETVLFFPRQGQTCHAYCTYCFRWPQFVGARRMRFASDEIREFTRYLRRHPEVSDVLLTGGDPLVMSARLLRQAIEPLLAPDLAHITSIRIGTKTLSYWPYRFLTDSDADDLLRLCEDVRHSGRQLAVMAHISHPRELQTTVAQAALRRLQDAGAVVRCQAPLARHVNDSAKVWANLWRLQIQLGAVPYYMFMARDTGAKSYFEVPLLRAYEIFRSAYSNVSGLARSVRGPSMSCTPGKVIVQGVSKLAGEDVFVLVFAQGRNPDWVGRPFYARLDPDASWISELRPAFGAREFFFAKQMRQMRREQGSMLAGADRKEISC